MRFKLPQKPVAKGLECLHSKVEIHEFASEIKVQTCPT